ncbi:hypothetical protein QBC46DRAFT_386769 [Diplogelasinospora grovesii]|uniref:Uncharacterized protein n=1 Tax=Diplogelasinospora grovesii TaxID=303347 RepID=A0AAN6N7Y5_9PEZI|nr:hypothetical protein QBC46DRAFT_386769 [Diplogelasinospora grovesii]
MLTTRWLDFIFFIFFGATWSWFVSRKDFLINAIQKSKCAKLDPTHTVFEPCTCLTSISSSRTSPSVKTSAVLPELIKSVLFCGVPRS